MKSSVRPPGCKLASRSLWSLTGPRAPETRSLEAAPSLDEAVGSRSPDEGGCQPPKQCGTTQALVLRYLRSFFAPEAHREGQYFTPVPARFLELKSDSVALGGFVAAVGSPAMLADICAIPHVPIAVLDDLTSPTSDLLLHSCAVANKFVYPHARGQHLAKTGGNPGGFGRLLIGDFDLGCAGQGEEGRRLAGRGHVPRWPLLRRGDRSHDAGNQAVAAGRPVGFRPRP